MVPVTKCQTILAKSESKSKMLGSESKSKKAILRSRMPVVLERLRTSPQINGNLYGRNG